MARPPSPSSLPRVSTSSDILPSLPPSRSPSPPLLTIRLVSPPTPRTSLSPALDISSDRSELNNTFSQPSRYHTTSMSGLNDQETGFASSFNPTLATTSTGTRTRTASLRSSLTSTLSFSTLFTSSTSISNPELSSSTSPSSRTFSPLPTSNSASRMFKVRTPSLGNTKKSNVGMVKNAMGLARRVSQNFKGRIRGNDIGNRGTRSLRRIDEDEFPYVGQLNEAKRMRQVRNRRRSSQSKFVRSPQTGRRTSSPPKLAQNGDFSFTRKPRRTSSPRHLKPTSRSPTPRKHKYKVRVSFVPPSSSSAKKMINRPRPTSRNSGQKIGSKRHASFEEEEDEWSEDDVGETVSSPRKPTSSRASSAKPFFRRFSLIRSSAPTPSTPRSNASSSPTRPESQPALTISHDPEGAADESFYCRGEFPVTPSSTRSPAQSNRLAASTSTRGGGSWFSSPRNAVYIPRFEGTDENYSPFSLTGSIKRKKEPEKGRHSLSPGDLTRYLEELLVEQEQGGSINEILERSIAEEDIFADAEEEEESGICKREEDFEFELSTESDRTMRSTKTFTLSLPPPRRHSPTLISQDSTPAHTSSDLQNSPLPPSTASSLDPFSLSLPLDPTSSETSSTEDEPESEPIIVLSASRQLFTRGQLARKHSISELVLHRSPSSPTSSSQEPPSPRSPLSPLSDNTLYAARSVSFHHFRKSSKGGGLVPHTAPLPETNFDSPFNPNKSKENFVTAPSTPASASSSVTSFESSSKSRIEQSTTLLLGSVRKERKRTGKGKGRREEMLPLEIYQDLGGNENTKKDDGGVFGEERESRGRRGGEEEMRRMGRPSC